MSENSRPWNGITTGDAGPYSDADWQELYRYIIGWGGNRANNGVFLMSGVEPDDGLKVTEQAIAAAGITVLTGAALIQGIAYFSDANENLTIAANASGNARIDTIILRADYALQTVRLAVLQGTPAASPVAPTLTQTPSVMWEIPIADIAVANGFTTIVNANVSQRKHWVNAPPGVYLPYVLNNSGVTLNDGDVVIWDATADRAVTTTTTANNRLVAGIWRGRTVNGGYGQLQTEGIGYVKVSAAVTRGDMLVTSATVVSAVGATRATSVIGFALETVGSSGVVLTQIRIQRKPAPQFALLEDQKATNTAGGASVATTWTTRDLNTEVEDANAIVTISANTFIPIAGTYQIHIVSPFVANAATLTHVRIRLRNATSAAVLAVSSNLNLAVVSQGGIAVLEHSFVANGTDAYDVQYYSTQARATNGLGLAINEASAVERYTQIYLEKVG